MRKAVLRKSGSRRRPRPARSRAAPPSNVTVLEGGKLRRFIRPDALAKASQKTRRDLTAQIMRRNDSIRETLQPYQPAPGVMPKDHRPPQMAMDDANINALVTWAQSSLGAYWTEGLTFMGYAELSNLTVRPEYRIISQVIATECTRKWIAFQSTAENKMRDKDRMIDPETGEPVERDEDGNNKEPSVIGGEAEAGETNTGDDEHDIAARDAPDREAAAMFMQLQQARQDKQDAREQAEAEAREQRLAKMDAGDDKSERIKELVDEMDRLNVRDLMYRIVELDGWMGRAHLYIDTGATDDREELKTSIGDGRDEVTKNKFQQGSLQRLAVIEPIWTYPQSYNASDPLREDWYNPSQWFVMGKELHATRLLTFIGRPVPDILKPAYSFGGLSLSQICKPYIDNWLQTRQSVNDIIHAFSVMVLQTDMGSVMQTSGFTMPQEGGDLFTRLDIFNMLRDNRGVFAIDKDSEDFKNVSAPLSSLDALQAQAQEHMASVSRIPLVKLLGISPHGLNATAEGELVAFYDTINAYQESVLRPNLTKIIHFAMMNLWGEIDEDITFKFEPLYALNEKDQAEVNKIKAETDDILINGCNALHPEEARKRVANEPDSPYEDIDITDVPEKPPEDSVNLKGSQPFEQGAQGAQEEAGQENQPPGEEPPVEEKLSNDINYGLARLQARENQSVTADAWNEADHPRVKGGPEAGQFTSGEGGVGGGATEEPEKPEKPEVKKSGGQYAGMYETKGASAKENHALTVAKVIGKPAQKGIHYRRLLARLIKEAPSFGGESAIAPLKEKLADALKMTHETLTKKGQEAEAAKVYQALSKLTQGSGIAPKVPAAKPKTPQIAAPPGSAPLGAKQQSEPDVKYKNKIQNLAMEMMEDSEIDPLNSKPSQSAWFKIAAVVKTGGSIADAKSVLTPEEETSLTVSQVYHEIKETGQATTALAKPTDAELQAAKKTTGYYPAPASAEGKAIAEKFNQKYQGKTITDPAALTQKVQDYKLAKAAIEEAEQQATAKAKAEAVKKAEQQKQKDAEAAKAAAAKNKQYMDALGINEQEAFGFGALVDMMGGNGADLIEKFKHWENAAKKQGLPISGFQAALISNYSDGGYSAINEALRKGAWTESQHVYVKMVNKALQAMPKHTGQLRRGTSLKPEQQALYKVGHIVEERAFTSTSMGKGFSGNTNYVISAIGKRGASILGLSQHSSEKEVLFAARTFFKVTKVEKSAGGQMTVHMEEMDD